MTRISKKIDCIKRLIELDISIDLINWIVENKFEKKDSFKNLANQLKAELILKSLSKAEEDGELILLDYEWSILPFEVIKVTCVTLTEKKEFIYGV
jgi:hypothetical protein